MSEDISKIISKHKMYMSFDGNEYEMIQKVELNKIFNEIERLNEAREIDIKYNKYLQKGLATAHSIINKAIELIETQSPIVIMPNNTLIHATEKVKVLERLLEILKGSDKK